MVCDHASSVIPDSLRNLGLAAELLNSHIAWDIGAASLSTQLAARWRAHALLAGVSRLVVDCNRAPGTCGWMPAETCGIEVPGNHGLTRQDIADRVREWYDPYHYAIEQTRKAMERPALIAVHSFTPELGGHQRPWHVGILWNRDGRLALPLMDRLRGLEGVDVGDNQPYSGQLYNYTLDRHADADGLPHVSIEIRQDLIADDHGVMLWAERLFDILTPILTDMGL